ncbi:hypothetical protein EVAR_43087_1 [Eumeta japonica]|uniref:Uncharacterized protein n=1 Tax=Eumeta variegata TaxID=151549 RepID=A0A4C1WXE4_EUMVA|nr:hypothetical protein EVAR_43087_1 [Eumeta japonica]
MVLHPKSRIQSFKTKALLFYGIYMTVAVGAKQLLLWTHKGCAVLRYTVPEDAAPFAATALGCQRLINEPTWPP